MVTIARSSIHGNGCFATEGIGAHAVIGQFECRPADGNGPHVLWLDDDPLLITNEFRFLNHSAEPNAVVDELQVRALRSIDAGEEITIHYGPDWTSASS
jgi:uncharacterized protein